MSEAGEAIEKFRGQVEPARPVLTGWMVDHEGTGSPKVTGKPGYVYVLVDRGEAQASGDVVEVWCRFRPVAGWPVRIGTTRDRPWEYSVLSIDDEAMGGTIDGKPILEHHAPMHVWCHPSGGDDVVYPRFLQLYDFAVWPGGGLTVNVQDGVYEPECETRGLSYTNLDLTAYKPGSGLRYVTIALSPTGTLEIVPGTIQATFLDLDDIPPAPSAEHWRLAAVRIRSTDTEIVNTCTQTNIVDLRFARLGWPITLAADADNNLLSFDNCHRLDLDSQSAGTFFAANPLAASKPYFRAIALSDLPVADGVTKTVGTGEDFATIQDAIDWFAEQAAIFGDCIISPDATSYDEAVVFSDLALAAGATLTLRGDTRALAGLSYVSCNANAAAWAAATPYGAGAEVRPVAGNNGFCYYTIAGGTSGGAEPAWPTTIGNTVVDGTVTWICMGVLMNQAGLANGGSGSCQITGAGNTITVTGSTTNPDFDADGWHSGDKILVYDNTGTTTEYTIDSVLNNAITLTVAAPAIGNDGTAICLLPNRRIDRTSAGPCVLVNQVRGVALDGWYLETSTGSECYGVDVQAGGHVELENVAISAEDRGIILSDGSAVVTSSGAVSIWGGQIGIYAINASIVEGQYVIAVAQTATGFVGGSFSILNLANAIAVNCTTRGYSSQNFSFIGTANATARQCGTGYYAINGAFLQATSTNANNNGNGTDYNPTPGAIPGYGNGNGNADIYAS